MLTAVTPGVILQTSDGAEYVRRVNMGRIALLLVPTLVGPAACFAPNEPVENETEGGGATEAGGSGSTTAPTGATAPMATTATSGSGSSTDPTDGPTTAPTTEDESTTGPGDDAPSVFESFTVNGSTRPAQVDASGFVMLEADVTDDMGVARVEFLVDDTVVATDEEAPFIAEHLVTSVDSGVGDYQARAFDSAGQITVSETVSLGVNIPGGEQLVIRRDVFESTSGFGVLHGGLLLGDDGGVYLFGTRPSSTGQAVKYNSDLSLLWESAQPDPLSAGGVAPRGARAIALSRRVETGAAPHYWEYVQLDREDGGEVSVLQHPLTLDAGQQTFGARFAEAEDGGVYATTAPDELSLRTANLATESWALQLGGSASVSVVDLDVIDGVDVIASLAAEGGTECAPAANKCIARIRADGSVAWTVGLESTTNGVPHTGVATDGTIYVAAGGNIGMRFYVVSGDGDLIFDTVKDALEQRTIQGLVVDPQDHIVIAGALGPLGDRTAWVGRFDEDADALWESELVLPDAELLDVDVSPNGRLYVMGTEDQANAGFGTSGDTFVAEFSL